MLYEEQSNVTSPCGRDWLNQTIFVNSRDFESGNYICHVSDAQLSRYYRRKRHYQQLRENTADSVNFSSSFCDSIGRLRVRVNDLRVKEQFL